MALTNEEIEYVRKEFNNSSNPLIFFDDDPDGLASFLLFYRSKHEGHGVIIKSTPELGVDFAKKVEEYSPDLVIILDKPMVSQDFIDACKGVKIIWIDHHAPQRRYNIKYFNPRIHDDKDNRPTSYWAYKIMGEDLWIAMAGIVGDWALPDDVTLEFKERYPELLKEEVTLPQEALFNSYIGKLSRIFSFLLKGKTSEISRAIKILTRIDSTDEILHQTSSRGKLLYKKYKEMEDEYQKLLTSVDTTDPKLIFFIYEESKISFTADLSNELLYKYPERMIIIGREKGDEVKLSFRSSKLALPPLLEKAIVGINGYAGGHTHACGGCIKKTDFPKFIENLKNLLN